jgi:hypothetical protein
MEAMGVLETGQIPDGTDPSRSLTVLTWHILDTSSYGFLWGKASGRVRTHVAQKSQDHFPLEIKQGKSRVAHKRSPDSEGKPWLTKL